MKTETRTRQKPEYYNVYIADDGTEFTSRQECVSYEFQLEKDKRKLPYCSGEDIEGYYADLWYIKSEEEFEWLKKTKWAHCEVNDKFDKEGWYIAMFHNGGDHMDWYDVALLDDYIKWYQNQIDKLKHLTSSEIMV